MVTVARPAVRSEDAGWLTLKLFALLAMLFDHVDWLLFASALDFHDTVGRAVFPLFALILGRNLARANPAHMLTKVVPRMALVGAVAALPYAVLAGPWPLNVMFTLAGAVVIHSAWSLGYRQPAFWAFLLFGMVVDYQWFGLGCVLASAWAFRRVMEPVLHLVAMAVILWPYNGSGWALSSIPVYLLCVQVTGNAPRLKWLFYAFYPLHLAVLAAIAFYW